MVEEKDRFGETMRLLERAKEDIYFAQRDRELIEKLKAQLRKVEDVESKLHCPKGHGLLETYTSTDSFWIAVRAAAASGWIKGNSKG
jgi:hypothetical protein